MPQSRGTITLTCLSNFDQETIKKKSRGKVTRAILLLQDIIRAQVNAVAATPACGFELLNLPPYCPDLAYSDYFVREHEAASSWNKIQGREQTQLDHGKLLRLM
ncbi:hypothetical protein Y032_0684g1506 [Ancylostoma ceylanicum]|uniref:Tc1-like transposase DDE domain-containing protein n=1 Tax=Ancylostoma ceylanicum TaxID=53326 RepID=A0A016WH74_9BILA|nr:hypothetical protein Y032_0684g1506 [Ancylostoma ceylanicum]